jgi:ubiquinone/menaquinone biosynthesis C-methylase UbiE
MVSLYLGRASDFRADRGGPTPRPDRYIAPLFEPSRARELLDDPYRDRWQQPARIVRVLRLPSGSTVADVGAGSGYLMRYLSRAVGPNGRVYAEEIQEEFLPTLNRRAQALGNVCVLLGTAEDPKLPEGGVDCFVLLTVYHEVQHPVDFLRTLHRYARPGTRLAIIDFDDNRHGSPAAPLNHWVSENDVLAETRAAGWELSERHEFLSSQFFLVFRPIPETVP